MSDFSFKDICSIKSNDDSDAFVGIEYDNGKIEVSFPLGYRLESDELGKRDDIFLLIRIISENCGHKKSEITLAAKDFHDKVEFPMQAYLFLIWDFMERGYYKETEIQYITAKKGKIDWARTIKTQKPYIQDGNAVYLDFVTRKKQVDEEHLITMIHKYCVYESFEKMGWLFTDKLPEKPRFDFRTQKDLCLSVIRSKMRSTFNDRNKQLFQNMYAMLDYLEDNKADTKFVFGTYDFEYVWQSMVDRLYGKTNKKNKGCYNPPTYWMINGEEKVASSELLPDTIMELDREIFVLDSKYYKYGVTGEPKDLPKADSINKQITYGEYIAENEKFKNNGNDPIVYNAFILPYDSHDEPDERFTSEGQFCYIGYATGDWKVSGKEYEIVLGILLDTKYLMQKSSGTDLQENNLAAFIKKKYGSINLIRSGEEEILSDI